MATLPTPPPTLPTANAVGASLAVGTILGAYEIEAVLGAGSMGQVYQARHLRLGRHVALKVLHAEVLADQNLVERFLQEGRAVNQMAHAHIVQVHDCVEERDPARVYCVMELLEGQTLAKRLEAKTCSIKSVRSMGSQIASALAACHSASVVHRDLKPENIFLLNRDDRDDWVKVLDFGIAKCVQQVGQLSTVHTAQGAVMGTPHYMAPEQVSGLEADARTDIYGLGVILYEAIVGRPPFEGASFGQLAAAILTQPTPELPKVTASGEPVPADLAALITACLSKKPADRPASMAEVEAALQVTPLQLTCVHRPQWRVPQQAIGLATAGLALVVISLMSTHAPAMQAVAVAVAAEVAPATVVLEEVTLRIVTQPAGALITDTGSGALLGHTPLEFKTTRTQKPLTLQIALDGFKPELREVSIDSDQRLELSLGAHRKKAARRPVTTGVLDAYGP